MNRQGRICEKLKKFGYASERRVRLYGEDLQLISNPIPDGDGYSVIVRTVRTGNLRHVLLPLSLVTVLEREVEREESAAEFAACL